MDNLSQIQEQEVPLEQDSAGMIQSLGLFRDPDRDMNHLVEFIRQSPQLTAATIRRSNHVFFSGVARTTNIFEAANRLGFYELRNIILSATRTQSLRAPDRDGVLNGVR